MVRLCLSNDREIRDIIHWLQTFSSAIRRTFVQYFTRFQLTACPRGPSATAGLLVLRSRTRHDPSLLCYIRPARGLCYELNTNTDPTDPNLCTVDLY